MRESLIEDDGVPYAEARGWLVYKWASPGRGGILDRLHFKKDGGAGVGAGVAFAIEYKATGEKATPRQRAEALRLKLAGVPCRCCDNVQAARAFIDLMTKAADEDDRLAIAILSNDISSFDP